MPTYVVKIWELSNITLVFNAIENKRIIIYTKYLIYQIITSMNKLRSNNENLFKLYFGNERVQNDESRNSMELLI